MNKHIESICKIGQGKICCKYLVMGIDGFKCAKNTALAINLNSKKSMIAQGDNCEGMNQLN